MKSIFNSTPITSMNYMGISFEIHEVTPEMAQEALDARNSRNRKRNERHVATLANSMEKGAWIFNGAPLTFDTDEQSLDGQHREAALVKSNKTFPFLVIKGLPPEAIDTIDLDIKKRSIADLVTMTGKKNGSRISAAVKKYFALLEKFTVLGTYSTSISVTRKYTNQEIMAEINDNEDFWNEAVRYSSICYDKFNFLACSEIAGIYAYLRKAKGHTEEEVKGFFDCLYFGKGYNNPIRLLRDLLIRDGMSDKKKMKGQVKQTYVTKIWNLYITGRGNELKLLKITNNEVVGDFI